MSSVSRRQPVDVFVAGRRIGALERSMQVEDTYLFTYAAGCKGDDAVSLTMPVIPDQYDSMVVVHPVFEMNLPEGRLREKLSLLFAKAIPDFDSLSLLEIVGKSQIGRLRYSSGGMSPTEIPAQSVEQLLAYQGAEDLFADLLDRYAVHSGISGQQPKVLLRDSESSMDRITDKGATHIVKSFVPREYPELAANEYFCMQAARYAGLPTANVRLADNRALLVVERFDIDEHGRYLGFEDFCVLSGMRVEGRYNSSYEDLAKKVARYVEPAEQAPAMMQVFGTVALACAIGNGDAHLKNFGIVYEVPTGAVKLAPVYDMLTTLPYQPRDVLALTLADSKRYPSPEQLLQFGQRACGLSGRQVHDMLARVADGIGGALQEMSSYAREHPDFAATAEFLERRIADQAKQCLGITSPAPSKSQKSKHGRTGTPRG